MSRYDRRHDRRRPDKTLPKWYVFMPQPSSEVREDETADLNYTPNGDFRYGHNQGYGNHWVATHLSLGWALDDPDHD